MAKRKQTTCDKFFVFLGRIAIGIVACAGLVIFFTGWAECARWLGVPRELAPLSVLAFAFVVLICFCVWGIAWPHETTPKKKGT